MAKKFLTGLQLLNLTSDPATGIEGEIYYNTENDLVRIYSDGVWTNLVTAVSASNITGNLNNIDSISTPNYIEFDTTYVSPSAGLSEGSLYWNQDDQTLNLSLENDAVLQIGQEEIYPPVINNSGVQINNGDLVMVTGVQGNKLTIAKAVTDGTIPFDYIIGIATKNIPDSADNGTIVKFGYVRTVNTSDYIVGTILYPDPTTPGGLTDIKPDAPGYRIPIAIVTKQGNSGVILVRMSSPSKLGETDSNIKFTNISDNDILLYNSASSIWINSPKQNIITTASAAAAAYVDAEISSLTTSDIEEGSNLYYTDVRALNSASTALVHGNHNGMSAIFTSNEIRFDITAIDGGGV